MGNLASKNAIHKLFICQNKTLKMRQARRLKAVFRNKIPAYGTYKTFRCTAACRFQAQAKVPVQIQATLSRLPLLCFVEPACKQTYPLELA